MTQIPRPNPAQPNQNDGEWLTKSQLARINNGTKAEIAALVKLGYLFPIRLGPRMNRFWSIDAVAGIKAYRSREKPPKPTMLSRTRIDWEA